MNTIEKAAHDVLSRMCDKCLAMYEREGNVLLADLCKPCQERLLRLVFEPRE
jgi:hypothetical protein